MCIIEVMKMMNSVAAGVTGRSSRCARRTAELVEYGQPLFRVAPASTPQFRTPPGSIEFVDTSTRDGNQSLWSATGPDDPGRARRSRRRWIASATTRSISPRARIWRSRCASTTRTRGSGSGSSAQAMPDTPLGMITTGMRFISWVPADEDVIGLSFRLVGPQRDPPPPDRRPIQRSRAPEAARGDGPRARGSRRW